MGREIPGLRDIQPQRSANATVLPWAIGSRATAAVATVHRAGDFDGCGFELRRLRAGKSNRREQGERPHAVRTFTQVRSAADCSTWRPGHVVRQHSASRNVGEALLPCAIPSRKSGRLMDEGMLIADLQSRHPPPLHVRMVAIRDMDALPASASDLRPYGRSTAAGAGHGDPR